MASGTDKEIFGEDVPLRVPTDGRPRINRDLARRLFQAGFTPAQVSKHLDCHVKTARRIRRELEEAGELNAEDRTTQPDIVSADFDEECNRATGFSFAEWLKNKTVAHRYFFLFCRRTWEKIWDRPSLVLVKDHELQLGDQLCMKFLEVFGEDKKRIRYRKKLIRFLFRFLGRHDLCDRHLTMTKSRDPISVRRIPEIELNDFPIKYAKAIERLEGRYGWEMALALKLKTVSQMRTGNRKKETGIMGIRVGSGSQSYFVANGPDDISLHVLEKQREEWDITWIPGPIRQDLWDLYQKREPGDPLFSFKVQGLRDAFKELTAEKVGVELRLHDARKISITWLYVCGVPLEIATLLNVGWKDLNTVRDHYLQLRGLLKNSMKLKYRENIPDWFKEGLEEYI